MPEVVAITGASAGVGRATVREFAKRSPGVRIGLLARNGDGLEGARREVEAPVVRRSPSRPTWPTPGRSRPPPGGWRRIWVP